MPPRGLLVSMSDPAESRFRERAPNELETNRQSRFVEPARNGQSGLPRRVEGHREASVGGTQRLGAIRVFDDQAVGRHGDRGHGGRR